MSGSHRFGQRLVSGNFEKRFLYLTVFLNSPKFNPQTPVIEVEQKMTKSFATAMAYQGGNYSTDVNSSVTAYTVRVSFRLGFPMDNY